MGIKESGSRSPMKGYGNGGVEYEPENIIEVAEKQCKWHATQSPRGCLSGFSFSIRRDRWTPKCDIMAVYARGEDSHGE